MNHNIFQHGSQIWSMPGTCTCSVRKNLCRGLYQTVRHTFWGMWTPGDSCCSDGNTSRETHHQVASSAPLLWGMFWKSSTFAQFVVFFLTFWCCDVYHVMSANVLCIILCHIRISSFVDVGGGPNFPTLSEVWCGLSLVCRVQCSAMWDLMLEQQPNHISTSTTFLSSMQH